ncbi:MAG: SRPBCC family protein [Vicinamibacterales bacterium]
MKTFHSRISIRATADRIWSILTDASRYQRWNPTVTKVEGRIATGERITVHATISQRRAFPMDVVTADAPRKMVWRGGMPLGLFVGERVFTLTPRPGGGEVEFEMKESFTGLLAPLIGRTIPNLQPAFDEFAAALKREAEHA